MFCRRWGPRELLPRADLLTYLLMQNEHITGVGLTGSFAREYARDRRAIHDIDLVVFHDGTLKDGSAQDPERMEPYYNNDIFLHDIVTEEGAARALGQARMGVPINYIVVGEYVLWDCNYLRSLDAQELFPEFYLRVFCDISLILLRPYYRKGLLRERVRCDTETVIELSRGLSHMRMGYPGVMIRHQCGNAPPRVCRPSVPWQECRREIRRRKGHWWHPFISLVGR